jgi:prepilin-type N-terminal cleavage/methylation domain-containing protein
MLDEKGYTYIELTIVLAVIAILSAVVIPSFKAVHRYELKKEAEIVRNTIRDAQKFAMSENKEFEVVIISNNQIKINGGLTEKKVALKNGVEFDTSSGSIVTYNSKGIPKVVAGNPIRDIKLKNDYKINVAINDVTGKVELGEITN